MKCFVNFLTRTIVFPGFPGDNNRWVPPDSISNSVVKPSCAYDSVGPPHAKVGHRQDFFIFLLFSKKIYMTIHVIH